MKVDELYEAIIGFLALALTFALNAMWCYLETL